MAGGVGLEPGLGVEGLSLWSSSMSMHLYIG